MKRTTLHWTDADDLMLSAIKDHPSSILDGYGHWYQKRISQDNTEYIRYTLLSYFYEMILAGWWFLKKALLWLFTLLGFACVMVTSTWIVLGSIL